MTKKQAISIMEEIFAEVKRPGMWTEETLSELRGAYAFFFMYEGWCILLEIQEGLLFIDELGMDKAGIISYITESFDELEGKIIRREIPNNK